MTLMSRLADKANPNHVSAIGLATSLLFLMTRDQLTRAGLLLVVLLFDLIDGIIGRRHGATFQGAIVDWSCDRLSECVIFFDLNQPWILVLPALNLAINLALVKRVVRKNLIQDLKPLWRRRPWRAGWLRILPLRHLYLSYLMYSLTNQSWRGAWYLQTWFV